MFNNSFVLLTLSPCVPLSLDQGEGEKINLGEYPHTPAKVPTCRDFGIPPNETRGRPSMGHFDKLRTGKLTTNGGSAPLWTPDDTRPNVMLISAIGGYSDKERSFLSP